MRHRKRTVKLGRTSAHRKAMLAGLVCDLIHEKRVRTTLPKARAARTLAERMVTLGKGGSLANRRHAIATLHQADRVKELFDDIAPSFELRQGGYTRILKLGKRQSDSAEMVLLEWVEKGEPEKRQKTRKPSRKKAAPQPKEDAAEPEPAPVAGDADEAAEEARDEAAEATEAGDEKPVDD